MTLRGLLDVVATVHGARPSVLGPSASVQAALLVVGAAWSGCADPGGSGASRAPDPEVDTIDEVVHVWNPPQGVWADGGEWSVEEVLRLGGLRGPEEELFGSAVLTTLTGPGPSGLRCSRLGEISSGMSVHRGRVPAS